MCNFEEFNELLDKSGVLYCEILEEKFAINAFFVKRDDNYIVAGELSVNDFRKFDMYSPYTLFGNFFGTPVTLINSYIISGTYSANNEIVSVLFEPSEIILGYASSDLPYISKIRMSSVHLNYMMNVSPIRASKNSPSIIEHTPPYQICCNDKYGQIRIFQETTQIFSREKWQFDIKTVVEYTFSKPMPISDAIGKLAAARNLFSFFANRFLPIEDVQLVIAEKENDGRISEFLPIILNHSEDIHARDKFFIVSSNYFSKRFELIWNNWIEFYEESYIPALFYEIICNRSTRVNRFLNLVQALEIFSKKYREGEAKIIAQKRNLEENRKKLNEVHLKHMLEDIFVYVEHFFELHAEEKKILSKKLADMRNLYTHYSGKYSEPSYEKIFAACHILEYILLVIVYLRLGIKETDISECMRDHRFQRLNSFVNMILD